MWNLWQKATKYSQLPSEVYGEEDSLAAWMLDSAVTWFGITIENALSERVKVKMGNEVQYRPVYTLTRLLNPAFKLPKPKELTEEYNTNPFAPFLAWAGKRNSGVKRYKYVPPEEKKAEE